MNADPLAIDELSVLGARFVGWRLTSDGRKIPVCPLTGQAASTTDPTTWGDLGEAQEAVDRDHLTGWGFVLDAARDGIVGVDLDGCRDTATGVIEPWALEVIKSLRSYSEVSPSGTGVKILLRADPVPEVKVNRRVRGKANGSHSPAVEIYTRARYFTITGQILDDVPDEIVDATEAFEKLVAWVAKGAKPREEPGHTADGDSPFRAVNAAALALLEKWVPALFPGARVNGSGVWRVSSKELGRDRQEDLSISPGGIVDFGEHDMGDPKQGRRTPIDLVMGHGDAADAKAAAAWLADRIGIEVKIGARVEGDVPIWDEPLDIIGAPELVGWPTLTADCLPAPLYRYVTAEAARLNVDPCPLAAHVIAACSISISDSFTIKPKQFDHYTQQARIWVCVVKNVGARGTEILNSAVWPLKARNAELHKEWEVEQARWQARQDIKKDKTDQPPKQHRVMTTDATVESMSDVLKHGSGTSKLGAIYDELVKFLGGFGRYGDGGSGAERGVLLEAYDGGPHWIDRVKRGHVYVPNWSLVVAGNIQPRRLAAMAANLVDDGLFQRFLTIHTAPPVLGRDDDKPSPPTIANGYRDLHAGLAGLAPVTADKPLPCYFDADGRAERQRFMRLIERLQVDTSLPTIIRETAPKWSGLLARLGLVFHLVELAEQRNGGASPSPEDICRVSGATVTMAANFLRRIALPNLFRLGFETMPEHGAASGHARWIAQHILAHGATTITSSEIGRAYNDLRGRVIEIAAAMEVLTDTGWVRPADSRKDGRRWEVNPAVHVAFATAAAAEKARRATVVELIKVKVQTL